MRHHDWQAELQAARRLYQATRLFYRRYLYQLRLAKRGQSPRFQVSWDRLKIAVVAGMHRIALWRLWRFACSNSQVAAQVWAPFVMPVTTLQSQS